MRILTLILCLTPLFIGCSLFNSDKKTSDRKKTPVRDVPYQARSGVDASLRKRIMVLPFIDSNTNRSHKVTDVARATVVKELINSRQFVVVNNGDFPQEPGKFITENREYDLSAMAKMAMNMGIAAVIEGKILEIKARRVGDEVGLFRKVRARAEVKVRVRAIAAKSGREILNEVRKASVEKDTTRVAKRSYSDRYLEEDPGLIRAAVYKAFRGSARKLALAVDKLTWEGRVALISGERVFINAGRLSGIQIGDILKITEEGEEVFDPDNGSFIGRAPGRMKGTVEVVTYFGKDGAISVVHSGSGFKENDRVELY